MINSISLRFAQYNSRLKDSGSCSEILSLFNYYFPVGFQVIMKNWSMYTPISRKVVGKNVHMTIPQGNIGYDQYTVPDTVHVAVGPTIVSLL